MSATAIGHLIYAAGLAANLAIRFSVPPSGRLPPEQLRLLAIALGVVAVTDYALSLWLERRAMGRQGGKGLPAPAAPLIVTAACGVSIAVYATVLWVLGAGGQWWGLLFGLACLHWFHSLMRWSTSQGS